MFLDDREYAATAKNGSCCEYKEQLYPKEKEMIEREAERRGGGRKRVSNLHQEVIM